MSWKDIIKKNARFMPSGNGYEELLDNLVYFVNQNFPELKQNMIKFEKERKEVGSFEDFEKLLELQNLFTRRNGVRDAFVDIMNDTIQASQVD
tara:strand:- start:439 stop:717 length:279 start_codon:yes stop_codon:yes gene_type:complete